MLVIAAATAVELRAALQTIAVQKHESHAGMHFFFGHLNGRDILLVQTGVGPKKAGGAANRILKNHDPCTVIALGAAGAADPRLHDGDIVIADTIIHHAGAHFPADAARSERIAQQLRAAGMPVHRGDCFTAGTFIHAAREKQRIFQSTGARVIDMESASLAKRLHPAGVPFLNIRIVSDAAKKDAFNIEAFYRFRGKGAGMGAYAYFIANPAELMRALRLKKNVRLVAGRIAAILEKIV